jgi:hypothetical protein
MTIRVDLRVQVLAEGDPEQAPEACEALGKLGPEAAEAVPAD